MPVVLIALGVVGVAWGVASWAGWLPAIRRRGLMGGVHPDLIPIGLGMMVIGVGGYVSNNGLELLGALLILIGVVLWLVAPSWLEPAWYKRRFPPR